MLRYICCCTSVRKEQTIQQSLTANAEDGRGDMKGNDDALLDTPSQPSDSNHSSPATRSMSDTSTPSSVTSINHGVCYTEASPDLNLHLPNKSTDNSENYSDADKPENSSQEEYDMSTTQSALDFDAELTTGGEDCDDVRDNVTYKIQHSEEMHRMNPLQSSMRPVSKSEVQ